MTSGRFKSKAKIVVLTGVGALDDRRIREAVGTERFTAPTDWFSQLEIELHHGQEVLGRITLSRAAPGAVAKSSSAIQSTPGSKSGHARTSSRRV